MTTSLKTWSVYADDKSTPLNESDKSYFRARTRRHVHDVVLGKFMELSDDQNLTRAQLAERLQVDRAQITRWLSSPSNWTLDTLSDLLLAMACQASVEAKAIGFGETGNYHHAFTTSLDPAPKNQRSGFTSYITEGGKKLRASDPNEMTVTTTPRISVSKRR